MYTFCVLILPLALAFFFSQTKNKANIILLLTGFLSGILLFALKEFFTFSHRMIYFSFGENFAFLFLRETLLPIVILYLAFFFLSKDDLDFKIKGFFPLVAAFYVIYLPYICITSPENETAFEVFFKPCIYAAVIFGMETCISLIFKAINQNKKLFAFAVPAIPLLLVLPAVTETLFLMNYAPVLYILLAILTVFIAFALKYVDFKAN